MKELKNKINDFLVSKNYNLVKTEHKYDPYFTLHQLQVENYKLEDYINKYNSHVYSSDSKSVIRKALDTQDCNQAKTLLEENKIKIEDIGSIMINADKITDEEIITYFRSL